uniref:F-box domain-containing protein n=1 Tax=viral metagenome TaxID=1070528 RepID=A0A6C0C337_9ZZZZ
MIKTLPEEIEKYIIKNYFHYSDIYYLSPVCKKWRDINNYITELKKFLKYVFDTCLIRPLQIRSANQIQTMELFGNSKRDWKGENLEEYFNIKRGLTPPGTRPRENTEQVRLEAVNYIKYHSGLFNENELMKICQSNNKTMIQITYFPSSLNFTDMFKNNLIDMKNQIIKSKKKYLLDPKNRGFKIKLHSRRNYTTGATTLIIWR